MYYCTKMTSLTGYFNRARRRLSNSAACRHFGFYCPRTLDYISPVTLVPRYALRQHLISFSVVIIVIIIVIIIIIKVKSLKLNSTSTTVLLKLSVFVFPHKHFAASSISHFSLWQRSDESLSTGQIKRNFDFSQILPFKFCPRCFIQEAIKAKCVSATRCRTLF